MKPKVYIETTIPSYLVARPSRDLVKAGRQQLTRDWWDTRRNDFDLYISQLVIDECSAGDQVMAQKRLDSLTGIEPLDIGSDERSLATQLIESGPLPAKAEADAFHIAVAAANAMDYLLTWNCKHIANGEMQGAIGRICREAGFEPPLICTPEVLLEK